MLKDRHVSIVLSQCVIEKSSHELCFGEQLIFRCSIHVNIRHVVEHLVATIDTDVAITPQTGYQAVVIILIIEKIIVVAYPWRGAGTESFVCTNDSKKMHPP